MVYYFYIHLWTGRKNTVMDKIEEAKKGLLKAMDNYSKALKEPDGFDWEREFKASGHEYLLDAPGNADTIEGFSDPFPLHVFKQDNTFPTKESAEKEAKRREVITKIKILAGDQRWVDWKEFDQGKYQLSFDHDENKWDWEMSNCYMSNFALPYFKDEKAVKKVIKTLGEELNILL